MSDFLRLRSTGNRAAAGYMFGVVIFFSLIPVVVALGSNGENPFLFNSAWRVGIIVMCATFLVGFYRPALSFFWANRHSPQVRILARRQLSKATLWFAAVNGFDYALLAWSIQFIDVSAAAVVFEFWPVMFVFLLSRLTRGDSDHKEISATTYPLFILVFLGIVIVTLSQSENGSLVAATDSYKIWIGATLALLGGAASACTAFSFKWASDLNADCLHQWKDFPSVGKNLPFPIFCIMVAFIITNTIAVVPTAIIGFGTGEQVTTSHLAVGLLGGALVQAVGSILFRVANLQTQSLGVNAIYYLTPCLTLAWLFIIGLGPQVRHLDFLVIGTVIIVIANLVVNFEAEIRRGFKALIIALWACGSAVYLRDDIYKSLEFFEWHWKAQGYFEAVGLSATVFTLLLAFRVARLAGRTTDEDNRTFTIIRRSRELVRRGQLDSGFVDLVMRIDDSKGGQEDLVSAYRECRRLIVDASKKVPDDEDAVALTEIEADVDALTYSKQQGPVLGELFALVVFAVIVIGLSLLSRPHDVSGWSAVLTEMIGMMLSTVIVFFTFNIWDLQMDRDRAIVQRTGDGDFGVTFEIESSQRFERWLSMIVGICTIIAFAILLWAKWIGT